MNSDTKSAIIYKNIFLYMVIMGIDPSINCTGVCIKDGYKYIYIMIPGKMTKKMINFKNDNIYISPYNKLETKGLDYEQKEEVKVKNMFQICNILEQLIKYYNVDYVCMEGISYGSVGSAALVDLSGLNFTIRYMLKSNNIPFYIVSPTSLKKFAVANGAADKELMIYAWQNAEPSLKDVKDIKIDDLADAYFLSNYPLYK
jgi:Holliday junction resolvasome RuvABC endonuclease subunit